MGFGELIQRRDEWIVVGAFVAQAAVLVVASWRSANEILSVSFFLLLVCASVRVLWRRRSQLPGVDMVIVPLAFGGLGMALGQTWVVAIAESSVFTGGGSGWIRRGLVLSAMLSICLPACIRLCSHDACEGRKRAIVSKMVALHVVMLVGVITLPWILSRVHGAIGGGLSRHVAGLSGMAAGSVFAVAVFRWRSKQQTQTMGCSEEPSLRQQVLLVEDSQEVRRLLSFALRRDGYEVMEVDSVEAAEASLQSTDMVVTDVELPGESGWALAERLRRERPDLPVVVISGNPERLQDNVLDVPTFHKPFQIARFLTTVRELLPNRTPAH